MANTTDAKLPTLRELLPHILLFLDPSQSVQKKIQEVQKSPAFLNFSFSPLGAIFEEFGAPSEYNLLAFFHAHYDKILISSNEFRLNFVALLIEVSAGDKTRQTDQFKHKVRIANISGNPEAIQAAKDELEEHRNTRAPPVKGVSIGREMMTHVRGLFEEEVKQLFHSQFKAAQAAKPLKTKKAAAAAKKAAPPTPPVDNDQEVDVDFF